MRSGLGLLEYLEFFEDVGMEPIMAVWSGEYIYRTTRVFQRELTLCTSPAVSGYALGGTSEPESALAGFIQQAKDQVSASSRGHR